MPVLQSRAKQMPCSSKLCKNLFGPVDSQQLQCDFEVLMRQQLEEAQQRWNFNFETETPLEGPFKWERVSPAEEPSQEVPSLLRGSSTESSRSSLGKVHSKGSRQSSELSGAGSSQSLKRGQTTMKEFYSSKRRIIPEEPKP